MQKRIEVLFTAVILATLATAALAQGGPTGGQGTSKYNPKTEVTLTGSIEDVQQQPCMGGHTGTHLMLKTQSGTDEVCVGPAAYIQQKGFSFAKGDQVEVIGSRVKFDGKDVVVARQITKEKRVLTLRNAQGIPRGREDGDAAIEPWCIAAEQCAESFCAQLGRRDGELVTPPGPHLSYRSRHLLDLFASR